MTERLKKIAEMEQILNEMNDLSEKVASVLEEWNLKKNIIVYQIITKVSNGLMIIKPFVKEK